MIIGVGEVVDRPSDLFESREPLDLMAQALRSADEDAGGGWLHRLDSLDAVNCVSWGYRDLPSQLCQSLKIQVDRRNYGAIGGDTPILYLHEAALAIASGKIATAAVCGAESAHSVACAAKNEISLPWLSTAPPPSRPRREGILHPSVLRHGLTDPLTIYPLYEVALQADLRESFSEWENETGQLWSRFSSVAAKNPQAWSQRSFEPTEIYTVSKTNRRVAGPYTKLMVANPAVNQGAAILLTNFANAKAMGVSDDRLVFVWGGSAASEPSDMAMRDQYARSSAMTAVLATAKASAEQAKEIVFAELYSCFPCVPKMAQRVLNLPSEKIPTVTGGLTFFGGPYNNYMTHATAAMTRCMRGQRSGAGLLYGQGGFLTKHHALVIATEPPRSPLVSNYSVQSQADAARGEIPQIEESFVGNARIEAYTIVRDREGAPKYGVFFVRTPSGSRALARIDDQCADGLALLLSTQQLVGKNGKTRMGRDGLLRWEFESSC